MELKNNISKKKEDLNTFKILLVDDRLENLITLEHIIEKENRTIIKADSGNEALKIVLGNQIDLILLDVQMPDMDGYEVAQLLRLNPKTKNIPIIFVSAVSKDEKVRLDSFEEATVDFLFKPLDIAETKSKIILYETIFNFNEEKKKYYLKIEQMSKEMDHFIYVVSHDVKAPLRAIENLASWIEEDLAGTDNKNVLENLSLMRNRVVRMQNLLDGVTEYSRASRINESKEHINTNQLVQNIIDALITTKDFKFNVQKNMPLLFTEKTKLLKVFSHLINNSIRHHNGDACIISISAVEENDLIRFTIADNGPGIQSQYHEKVFEIFHTLQSKDQFETAGVGLSIVKRIVESHGNKIWIDSPVDCGTTVHFTWNKK